MDIFVCDTEHTLVIVLRSQPLFKGDMNEDNLALVQVVGFENVTLLEYFPISEMALIDGDPVVEEVEEDHDQLFSKRIQLL